MMVVAVEDAFPSFELLSSVMETRQPVVVVAGGKHSLLESLASIRLHPLLPLSLRI